MEAVDFGEGFEHTGVAAVVGEFVVVFTAASEATGFAGPFEGDDAGGVGDEGEVAEFHHDIDPHGTVVAVAGLAAELEVLGFDLGLWDIDPGFHARDAKFGFPNGGEVFLELCFVGGAEFCFEGFGVGGDAIEDGFFFSVATEGGGFGVVAIGNEESFEESLRAVFGGEGSAFAVETQGMGMSGAAGAGAIGKLEGGEAGLSAVFFGHELIGGNGVGVLLAGDGGEVGSGEPGVGSGVSAS